MSRSGSVDAPRTAESLCRQDVYRNRNLVGTKCQTHSKQVADERSAGPLALGVARQRWKAGTTKSGRWPSCRESVGLPLAVTARRIHLTPATEQAVRTTNSIAPARLPSGSAASRCDRSRPAAGW